MDSWWWRDKMYSGRGVYPCYRVNSLWSEGLSIGWWKVATSGPLDFYNHFHPNKYNNTSQQQWERILSSHNLQNILARTHSPNLTHTHIYIYSKHKFNNAFQRTILLDRLKYECIKDIPSQIITLNLLSYGIDPIVKIGLLKEGKKKFLLQPIRTPKWWHISFNMVTFIGCYNSNLDWHKKGTLQLRNVLLH